MLTDLANLHTSVRMFGRLVCVGCGCSPPCRTMAVAGSDASESERRELLLAMHAKKTGLAYERGSFGNPAAPTCKECRYSDAYPCATLRAIGAVEEPTEEGAKPERKRSKVTDTGDKPW